MCKAFSCIVGLDKSVTWKFGVDSHTTLLEHAGYKDVERDPAKLTFARVEITPDNGNYLEPDNWSLAVDEQIRPAWFSVKHEEAAFAAHKKWLAKLNKIVVHGPLFHPLQHDPPKKITAKHIALLRAWASAGDSVGDSAGDSVRASLRASVGDSVGASVGASLRASVGASVRASVWASVWASVGASVWAYTGSRFNLPRKAWKYTEGINTKGYPFQPCVDLWMQGLVPSFDGKTWRLHGGPKATILFEIKADELRGRK